MIRCTVGCVFHNGLKDYNAYKSLLLEFCCDVEGTVIL